MQMKVNVVTEESDDIVISSQTNQLFELINRETVCEVTRVTGANIPRMKGGPIEQGSLLITLITSGSLVALFEVFKAFVCKGNSIHIEFEDVKIVLQNTNHEELNRILEKVHCMRTKKENE